MTAVRVWGRFVNVGRAIPDFSPKADHKQTYKGAGLQASQRRHPQGYLISEVERWALAWHTAWQGVEAVGSKCTAIQAKDTDHQNRTSFKGSHRRNGRERCSRQLQPPSSVNLTSAARYRASFFRRCSGSHTLSSSFTRPYCRTMAQALKQAEKLPKT